jgi:hypothetical protein
MKQLTPTKLLRAPVSLILTLMCLALVMASTGCRSFSGPNSASFASEIIKNHSGDEIATATSKVFAENGYKGGMTGQGEMTFEKEASRATTVAREGLINTYYGEQSINRVRVELIDLGNDTVRLQCKAYKVSGGTEAFFQDEVPIGNTGAGPYRSMLKKVADQLK